MPQEKIPDQQWDSHDLYDGFLLALLVRSPFPFFSFRGSHLAILIKLANASL